MGIITGKAVPRRTFLRGLGATAVALPFLDAMTPAFAAPKAPVRLAFLYVPNGIHMRDWTPNARDWIRSASTHSESMLSASCRSCYGPTKPWNRWTA